MKLPNYLDKKWGVRLIRFNDGTYTTQVHSKNPEDNEKAVKWIQKHGKTFMEQKLGYKIKVYKK